MACMKRSAARDATLPAFVNSGSFIAPPALMALPKLLSDNLALPVIGSPLFIASNPKLVIEQC